MHNQPLPPRLVYLGFALVSLATITYQLLLTRVFSVTIWYHFAFFVISIALFGMTVGAVHVYVWQKAIAKKNVYFLLTRYSVWFSVLVVMSFLFHMIVPFIHDNPIFSAFFVTLTYLIMSAPFVVSGAAVALILTHFSRKVESLYAADLIGAALGCLVLIASLTLFDAPSAVFFVAALPLFAALAFYAQGESRESTRHKTRAIGIGIAAILLIAFAIFHTRLVSEGNGMIRPLWVKGEREVESLYEKWNPISRVRVSREGLSQGVAFGWGMSPYVPSENIPDQLLLTIDANAATVFTNYNGSIDQLEYLKYDITNSAHVLRRNANIFVIGVGGGRDLLSALVFDQAHVTGAEINGAIIHALTNVYGDYTGGVARDPRVTIVHDEARSYLARTTERFDIIQMSLIDTWAATAAGAYTLTENTLYTTDAWKIFYSRLKERGILTFSRWYLGARPAETYRLIALAAASLKETGVSDTRDHLILLRVMSQNEENMKRNIGIVTLLASPTGFHPDEIARISKYADIMGFEVILSPQYAESELLGTLAKGVLPREIPDLSGYQIDAPTDNNPFYFQTVPIRTIVAGADLDEKEADTNTEAVLLLVMLFCVVSLLTLLTIILPLRLAEKRFPGRRELPLLLYFLGIGGGFILIEIVEMQRFIVFLGQPTYALSVVLFTLLLAAGFGAWTVSRIPKERFMQSIRIRFIVLLGVLILLGILHTFLSLFEHYALLARIAITIGILVIPGFFMGMFFPAGMRLAHGSLPDMIPWFWGVNGAMSVFASVLAPLLAIAFGFHVPFWVGFACYLITFLVFLFIMKQKQ